MRRAGSSVLLLGRLFAPVLSVPAPRPPSRQTAWCSSDSRASAIMADAELPRWNLEARFGFKTPYDDAIDAHVKETESRAKAFKDEYDGQLETKSLLAAVKTYEDISSRRTFVSSYLHLSYDTALNDDALKKRKGALSQESSRVYGDYLEWFSLDLAEMPQEALDKQYAKDAGLEKYRSFIDETRRQQPHNLAKDVERALTVRAPFVGTRPMVSFFDKELSLMKFKLPGDTEEVNMEVLLSRMQSSKDAPFRAACLKALNDGLGGHVVRVAALSLSAVTGSWHIENKERKHAALRSQRNLDNNCPDEVVDGLLDGVRAAGVPLCKRYYGLKKRILFKTQGLERMTWSDRNAPIDIGGDAKDDDKISWDKAVAMVDRAYRKFSPRMAEMFMSMVKEKRIDVPAEDGKKGGAYCAGVCPGVGPFQLLNFDGTKQDVATLAHESGHGCHDILAYPQGYLQYHPPLTLAETASIFGEMIVFRDLLGLAKTKEEELALLMSKIDDVVNSVVRQCSFDYFEELAHKAREKGELTAEELDTFWKQALTTYYGEAKDDGGDSPFDTYADVNHLWSYVPHFHHVPFYVYSYAFADLVVGTLYSSFLKTPEGFEDRLLELLAAGGTKDFAAALQPFGLDPTDKQFWEDALNAHLGGLVAEAERLAKELGYMDA